MSMMRVGLKILSNQNLLQNRNSMYRIGNGAILIYQCRFHSMEHLYMCHGNFILISIILILHGLIIRICHFLLDIFVQIILHIKESAIKKSPPANNDRFNHKNRSVQKKKHKLTKQVYRVKKDGRLSRNSDLTQLIEKPC